MTYERTVERTEYETVERTEELPVCEFCDQPAEDEDVYEIYTGSPVMVEVERSSTGRYTWEESVEVFNPNDGPYAICQSCGEEWLPEDAEWVVASETPEAEPDTDTDSAPPLETRLLDMLLGGAAMLIFASPLTGDVELLVAGTAISILVLVIDTVRGDDG